MSLAEGKRTGGRQPCGLGQASSTRGVRSPVIQTRPLIPRPTSGRAITQKPARSIQRGTSEPQESQGRGGQLVRLRGLLRLGRRLRGSRLRWTRLRLRCLWLRRACTRACC